MNSIGIKFWRKQTFIKIQGNASDPLISNFLFNYLGKKFGNTAECVLRTLWTLWFEASTACKNRPAIKNLAETGDLPVAALPRSIVSLTTILEKIKGTNKQTQT